MTPAWLDQVLAGAAVLDLHHADGRAQLAERILAAIPKADVIAAIAGSTRTVLEQRGLVVDGGVRFPGEGVCNVDGLVAEIGRNAANTVLFALEEPVE